MKPLLKCLGRVNALVFGGWLFVTPPGNDVKRPLKEWSQERSFDTLQECESYRERQAAASIKRIEKGPVVAFSLKGYIMETRIKHVAICTENYDRMADFYKTIFGMKKITNG